MSHSEKIAAQKRADLLHYLMYEYHLQEEPPPITKREKKILELAGRARPYDITQRSIGLQDLDSHAKSCAYYIVTQQHLECREVELPGHEKQMIAWRIAQGIIFFILLYGIKPIDWEDDIVLSRGWIFFLFLAFVAITAWCRYCDKWYTEHQRKTVLLNTMVGNAEIKIVLLDKKFAEDMRRYYISEGCKHRQELALYLRWWHERSWEEEPFESWVKHSLTP